MINVIEKLVLLEYLDELKRKGYNTRVIWEFLKSVDKRIDKEIKQEHFK